MKNVYFVGAPTAAKGVAEFDEVASLITEAKFYWFCYHLDKTIKEMHPHIHFIVGLDDTHLRKKIRNEMDIFVSCSHFEGFCLPIAEAIMLEKPVISYQLEEIESEFGNTIGYVSCFDLEKMKDAVRKEILKTPNKRKLLTAKKVITKQYSPKQVMKRFLSIIHNELK